MWLLHMEEMDGCKIKHARNEREYRLPELPPFSADGYCAETSSVHEFWGSFFMGANASRSVITKP